MKLNADIKKRIDDYFNSITSEELYDELTDKYHSQDVQYESMEDKTSKKENTL